MIKCRTLMLLFAVSAFAHAATPPQTLNYQGVLRDASDRPLDGDHDMVFRFFDAAVLGNEILVDEHLATGSGTVTVSGGLFNVALGGGSVADGSGPGTYASLGQVFRDHADVYLEVTIGAETLSPRVEIVASAFALNAAHLEGASLLDLQTEIDGDVAAHSALPGIHHAAYTDADADARIAAHAGVPGAHHIRYTDQEARDVASSPGGQPPRNQKQIGMLRWYDALAATPVEANPSATHSRAIAFDGESIWLAYGGPDGPTTTSFALRQIGTSNAVETGVYNIERGPVAAEKVAGCIVYDGKHLWTSVIDWNLDGVGVYKFREGETYPLLQLGPEYASAFGCAADGEYLWLRSVRDDRQLVRVRSSDGSVTIFDLGVSGAHGGIAFDGTHIWAVNSRGQNAIASLSKVRPSDGAVLDTVDLRPGTAHMEPRGIIYDGRYLWIAFYATGMTTLTRVDPQDPSWGAQTVVDVRYRSFDLAFDGRYIWVTHPLDNRVSKILATDGKPVATYLVTAPNRIAFDGANIWVTQLACGSRSPDPLLGACAVSVPVAAKF